MAILSNHFAHLTLPYTHTTSHLYPHRPPAWLAVFAEAHVEAQLLHELLTQPFTNWTTYPSNSRLLLLLLPLLPQQDCACALRYPGLDPHRLTNARTALPRGSFNPILSPSWSTGRRRRPRRARRSGHIRILLHHLPTPTRTSLRQRRRGPGHEPDVSIAAARSASATRGGLRAEAALAARKGANGASKSPSVLRMPRRSCKITRQ